MKLKVIAKTPIYGIDRTVVRGTKELDLSEVQIRRAMRNGVVETLDGVKVTNDNIDAILAGEEITAEEPVEDTTDIEDAEDEEPEQKMEELVVEEPKTEEAPVVEEAPVEAPVVEESEEKTEESPAVEESAPVEEEKPAVKEESKETKTVDAKPKNTTKNNTKKNTNNK